MNKVKQHYIKNNIENIRLPVPPSSFTIKSSKNSTSVTLLNFGEINSTGRPTLKTWEISSFFPAQDYTFVQGTRKSNPYDYCSLIDRLKDDNVVCQYVITQTNIRINCTIEDFEYGEQDGSCDVYYKITLKEHKEITLSTISNINTNAYLYYNGDGTINTSQNGGNYTVKDGDTIVRIAKLLYGDSSKYKQLMKKNGLKNVNDIRTGMVLKA